MGLGDDPGADSVDEDDNRARWHTKELRLEHVEAECLVDEEVAEGAEPPYDCGTDRRHLNI